MTTNCGLDDLEIADRIITQRRSHLHFDAKCGNTARVLESQQDLSTSLDQGISPSTSTDDCNITISISNDVIFSSRPRYVIYLLHILIGP